MIDRNDAALLEPRLSGGSSLPRRGQDPKAAVEWVEGLSDPAEGADLRAVLPEAYRKR